MKKEQLRLDKWLFHARLIKQRSMASALLSQKRVRLNKKVMEKTHYPVRPGDVLTLSIQKEIKVIEVVSLGTRRGPATEAQTLYKVLERV